MPIKIVLPWRARLGLIWVLCLCLFTAACSRYQDTDYVKELARLKTAIDRYSAPATQDDALQLVYYRYQYASLTVDYDDLKAVENAIAAARQNYGPSDDLYYFGAYLNFKLHRLQGTQDLIAHMPNAADSTSLQALRADIALQQGRYTEALQGYEELIHERRSWDALARLAYYRLKTGRPEEADALYRQAADMIPANDMRSYAWLELQRGLVALEYGHYEQALEHYRTADRAWSGYWLIEEHIAEALRLTGDIPASVALYKKIIERTHKPEYMTALANMLAAKKPAASAALYREADTVFGRQLALYPEAASGHLIESLLQKPDIDPRLQEYAERNHAVRPNSEAKLLLARAYLKLGKPAQAKALIGEIMQTPWRTPQLNAVAADLGIAIRGKT
jgi:tetratricopeptide (TPR) repeat protein